MSAFVYMMTNRKHETIYTGSTTNIAKRAWEHREGVGSKFTSKYELKRLVFLKEYDALETALQREKNIKSWPRAWKVRLIETTNPDWHDLYEDINR